MCAGGKDIGAEGSVGDAVGSARLVLINVGIRGVGGVVPNTPPREGTFKRFYADDTEKEPKTGEKNYHVHKLWYGEF